MATKKRPHSGFSLLEMAIVVTIVGIMLYTTLGISTAQSDMAKIRITQEKLKRIDQALTVYFNTNGYLPCPARPAIVATDYFNGWDMIDNNGHNIGVGCDRNDGIVDRGSGIVQGTIPTRNLGLPDDTMFDGWGNRISYAVSEPCTRAMNWQTRSSFYVNLYKCSSDGDQTGTIGLPNQTDGGSINIVDSTGTTWTVNPPRPVYILISHGKNGYRAYPRNGGSPNSASSGTYENLNGFITPENRFGDMPINDGSGAGTRLFDDIVRWRTGVQLYYDADY